MKAGAASAWRQTGLLAIALFAWLAATAWLRPLMLPDEGRYVGVAWEMLRSGDWLTPTLNGLPYFHKPPLFYWITAASMSVFGLHEGAARAAPLLGAWTAGMALYLFVRRWWSEVDARRALVVLAVQPLFFLGGQFANLDMLVAGCITATTLLLADAALSIETARPHRAALAGAYAMAALGLLAKGLIGFVLPALVIGLWLVLRRRWRTLARLLWWPGALLFVAIAAPWFLAMQQRYAGFLDYFFVVQHFKRFTETGFNNAQPFWFYPALLIACSLPWWPWARAAWRQSTTTDGPRAPVRLLMVVWLVAVVVFFSLPHSKLVGYILPAVPPLALWWADGYARTAVATNGAPSTASRRLWLASAGLAALIGVSIVVALAVRPMASHRTLARALQHERSNPAQPVVMLQGYAFDWAFYARSHGPAVVVDAWDSPEVQQRDNWRKELADAGTFAPELAAAWLIAPQALPNTVCRAGGAWVVAREAEAATYPFLTTARLVARERDNVLWQVDATVPVTARALGCAETPNGDSARK